MDYYELPVPGRKLNSYPEGVLQNTAPLEFFYNFADGIRFPENFVKGESIKICDFGNLEPGEVFQIRTVEDMYYSTRWIIKTSPCNIRDGQQGSLNAVDIGYFDVPKAMIIKDTVKVRRIGHLSSIDFKDSFLKGLFNREHNQGITEAEYREKARQLRVDNE